MNPIRPIAAPTAATTVLRATLMFRGIPILGKLIEKLLWGMRKRIAIVLPIIKISIAPKKNAVTGVRTGGIHPSCGSSPGLLDDKLDIGRTLARKR
jgi:hypothetical protein